MDSPVAVAAAVTAGVVVVVLGMLVLLAWGARAGVAALGAAPLVCGVVAAYAFSGPVTRAPFTLLGVGVALVLVAATGYAARRAAGLLRRRRAAPDPEPPGVREALTDPVAVLYVLLGTLLLATTVFLVATRGDLSLPSQTFDSLNHQSLARHIVEGGAADPWTANRFLDHRDTSFYPTAFSALAATVCLLLRVDAVVGCNLTAVLMAGLVWPSAMMLLARQLLGRSAVVVGAVGALSMTAWGMPWAPLGWGVLWPTMAAAAYVPVVLLGLVLVLGIGERRPRRALGSALTVLGAVVGSMYHPRGLVLAAPLLLVVGFCWLVRRGLRHRARPWSIALGGLLLAATSLWDLVAVATLAGVDHRVLAVDWPVREDVPTAVVSALTGSGDHTVPSVVLTLLAAVGLVVAVRSPRLAWLPVALVVLVALDVTTASVRTSWSGDLTRYWYSDRYRSATATPVVLVLLAGVGVRSLVRRASPRTAPEADGAAPAPRTRRERRVRRAATGRPRLGSTTAVTTAVAVISVLAVAASTPMSMGYLTRWYATLAGQPTHGLASAEEVADLRTIGTIVPRTDIVLNNPLDGSALLYPVAGVRVSNYTSSSEATPHANALRSTLIVDGDHDRICGWFRSDGIRWVVNGGPTYSTWATAPSPAPYMQIPEGFWATTLVFSHGDLKLYEVTGCPGL
ncbi:DUF6541 family protein [Lapillicoccus jejuensis]|uniref:Uncharacterized protein n=1 Tax=Lapillicoccus jejuensis TaxID=402171 RepID=A0A542DW02_9MICO|nr:DUF6541 family protein [Lapillicoccus jejuensis]TQJ07282.1 hypothetical protein FB458_0340 [Lapillicoccus jejuensis]